MADTKISALADIVALAAGDKIPVADASDLTATKSATMTEVNAYLQTLPLVAAQVSGITGSGGVAGTNEIPVNEAGTAKKATVTQLNAYLQTLALASAQITALPAASALAVGNTFPVDQSGTAGEATLTQLLTLIFANHTSTAGVANSPTATQTDSITHGLGRTPVKIRIYGMSAFVANAAALPPVHSIGIWCSSGNRSISQPYDAATITAAEPAITSTTNAIRLDTGVGNSMVGVIQNVGATTFDIAWTETGTHTAQPFMWEAE